MLTQFDKRYRLSKYPKGPQKLYDPPEVAQYRTSCRKEKILGNFRTVRINQLSNCQVSLSGGQEKIQEVCNDKYCKFNNNLKNLSQRRYSE